jgi:plastocyanin
VADEETRRRRGRRRGGSSGAGQSQQPPVQSEQPTETPAAEAPPEPTSEAPASSGGGKRFGLFGGGNGEKQSQKSAEKPVSGASGAAVPPMEFWRRGAARSAKPSAAPHKQLGLWQRITGMHFPAWMPVVGIIFVVFAILGGLFYFRSAAGAPRIGTDHWHARYTFTACGQRQPNAPFWNAGVHTHADGIIHIHPHQTFEEGSGARLVKWFEYGGGQLTNDKIRMPGSADEYENGDTCPDGSEGEVQVFVTGSSGVEERLNDVDRYIPQDGDSVRIVFGPEETEPVRAEDRTIIDPAQATRDSDIVVTDDPSNPEGTTRFDPNRLQVNAGEVVKFTIRNTGSISHGFRIRGPDGEYGTSDDFVVTPDGEDPETTAGILQPGAQGTVIVRLGTSGEVEFRDETLQTVTGTIVVGQAPEVTASPTPVPAEAVDFETAVVMKDNVYEPAQVTLPVGKKFRINLTNEGPAFAHNMRIAGPDGEFETDDDLASEPRDQRVGAAGELVGQIDTPGTYNVRCDFHPEQTGTVTVQ